MKKVFSMVVIFAFTLLMAACQANPSSGGGEEAGKFPDLIGEWKQSNSNSEDSWQRAKITSDSIEVYWVTDGGDTESLYWSGTFENPTSADEPYICDSQNNHEKTDVAMLASSDDIKSFTYKDGELSYSVSAFGTTTTVKLKKQ